MKQVFSMEGTKEIDKQTIEKVGIPSKERILLFSVE